MKDVMQYKNFIGSVHFSASDEIFYGKIEGINDLVTFEGDSDESPRRRAAGYLQRRGDAASGGELTLVRLRRIKKQ